MPGQLLDAQQMRTLLTLAGIARISPASPLAAGPSDVSCLHAKDPRFEWLCENHLLEPSGDGWRVNALLGAAMLAAAHPDEIIRVAVNDSRGFALVRRGPLWCECTVTSDGRTKLQFPLTRSSAILVLVSALSGDTFEPEPSGFHFVGSAEEAFALSTAARVFREWPVELPLVQLRVEIRRAAGAPGFAGAFCAVAGPDALSGLAGSDARVEKVIGRLAEGGYLELRDGRTQPSPAVLTALGGDPRGRFSITRTVATPAGQLSAGLLVIRAGQRKLVFRLRQRPGEAPLFEWAEMNRQQIRGLVAGMLLPDTFLTQGVPETPKSSVKPGSPAK